MMDSCPVPGKKTGRCLSAREQCLAGQWKGGHFGEPGVRSDGHDLHDIGCSLCFSGDVRGVHGIGGFTGIALLGIFGTLSVNPAGADGLLGGGAAYGPEAG